MMSMSIVSIRCVAYKFCNLRVTSILILLLSFSIQNVAASVAGTETLIGIVGDDFVLLGADTVVLQSIVLQSSNQDKITLIANPFPAGRRYQNRINDMNENGEYKHFALPEEEQQTIAVAAAGDMADTGRLVGLLKAHASLMEYEASVGCDVQVYDCSGYELEEKGGSSNRPSFQQSSPLLRHYAGLSVHAAARLARSQISTRLRSPPQLRVCLLVAGMMPVAQPEIGTARDQDSPTETKFVDSLPVASTTLDHSSSELFPHYAKLRFQLNQASLALFGTDPEPKDKGIVGSKSISADPEKPCDESSNFPSHGSITNGLEPRLYWLDDYGSIQNVKYGAHGYGSNFCLSILDQGYYTKMNRQDAIELMKRCFEQLRSRFVMNTQPYASQPCIKCIDKDGCTNVLL